MPQMRGFTLIEMVVVMLITAILFSMGAGFVRIPIQSYIKGVEQAGLIDVSARALNKMNEDLQKIVPNSIRMFSDAGGSYLEFLPLRFQTIYPSNNDTPPKTSDDFCKVSPGDSKKGALDFKKSDDCFVTIDAPHIFLRGATDDLSDQMIVEALAVPTDLLYDATLAGVRRPYNGAVDVLPDRSVVMVATQLAVLDNNALANLTQSVYVVPGDQQAVTYACENIGVDANGNGTGTLKRYWRYGFNVPQVLPSAGALSSLLLDHLSTCSFLYSASVNGAPLASVAQIGVVLEMSLHGETISLADAIPVDNRP